MGCGEGYAPQGTCSNVCRHSWLSQLGRVGVEGASGIQWEEARDAAKYPTVPQTAPTTSNYPNQSAKGAKAEKCLEQRKPYTKHIVGAGTLLDVLELIRLLLQDGDQGTGHEVSYATHHTICRCDEQSGYPTVTSAILHTLSKASVFLNLSFPICKMWFTIPTSNPWSR